MKRIKITFDTDNAAFDGDASSEIQEVLKQITSHLQQLVKCPSDIFDINTFQLRDTNGNTIGEMTIE